MTAIPIDLALERADHWLSESRKHQDANNFQKASIAMERAYREAPMAPRVWFAASVLKMKLRDFQWAYDTLSMTHQAIPSEPLPCLNAGLCAISLGKYEDAKHWLWKATKRFKGADSAVTYQALGSVHSILGNQRQAKLAYETCLNCNDATPEDRFNKGLVHLLMGNYKQGFELYENRLSLPGFGTHRKSDLPMWDGSSPGRVLVLSEQGMGDSIMMSRYVVHMWEHGYDIGVSVPQPLVTWFAGLGKAAIGWEVFSNDHDAEEDTELAPFDFQIPMMSLPRVFGVIPPADRAKPQRFSSWAGGGVTRADTGEVVHFQPMRPQSRVGICWSGNKDHSNDRDRSMPLERVYDLFKAGTDREMTWVTLQQGASPEDIMPPRYFESFQATAELIETLDAVISVDTAVAHLSATLGVPTIMLAPTAPEWRWGLTGDTTPWYPSMQIVRRKHTNDWPNAIQEAASRLKELLCTG